MTEFLWGIITSLSATIIIIIIAKISKSIRVIIVKLCNILIGGDIEYIYKDKKDSLKDIIKLLEKADKIDIYTGRGNEFQQDTFLSIFRERKKNNNCRVRILLPMTDIDAGIYDWTKQREDELSKFDSSFKDKYLHKQIETNIEFLQTYVSDGSIELRRYNSPHIGRIMSIDGIVFYTPYEENRHGRNSSVIRYKGNGVHTKNLNRYFEQIWNAI